MKITHGCRTCGAEFPEREVDAFLRHVNWCQNALPPARPVGWRELYTEALAQEEAGHYAQAAKLYEHADDLKAEHCETWGLSPEEFDAICIPSDIQ